MYLCNARVRCAPPNNLQWQPAHTQQFSSFSEWLESKSVYLLKKDELVGLATLRQKHPYEKIVPLRQRLCVSAALGVTSFEAFDLIYARLGYHNTLYDLKCT